MGFINKCSTILRRYNKDMLCINVDNGISINYFDKDNMLIHSDKLIDKENIDFTKCYFTLDKFDNVYGIYNNKCLKIIEIHSDSYNFLEKEVIEYNFKKFDILFPYIQFVNNSIHIIYYVYNNNSNNICALFHHYKHNDIWTENKIDFINHIVLDNYVVLWSQDSPVIFYFNLVNGCEELFISRFNSSTLTWSNPVQITNSNKNKIYLSVLKDSMNFYHISFCENMGNGYAVKYINGYLNDSMLDIDISTYITGPSTCMYPSFVKNGSTLYLMWINYGKLNTSSSINLGKDWSDHEIDEFSIEDEFIRANFFSNYKNDMPYNVSSVFTTIDDIGILGF